MNDKQKEIVDTLQLCYTYCNVDEENTLVPQQTVLDAISLLKAQEPRMMTLQEVKDSIGKDMFLEIASYPGEPSYITASTLDGVGTGGLTFYHNCFEFECYNKKTYGWRCWTSRPTDEQRKAVKWNG